MCEATQPTVMADAAAPTAMPRDASQLHFMETEQVILLDMDDKVVGHASKKDSHLNKNIQTGMLHRAFSVFMFNKKGELLLQKRASDKITFPMYWTNTCCSHPLFVESEMEPENQIGVKRAAQRKLLHELGIKAEDAPTDAMTYIGRVYYGAPSDDVWGEHEIDYIIFMQRDVDEIPVDINKEEVDDTRYVTFPQVMQMIKDADAGGTPITPWFRLMCETKLEGWWKAMLDGKLDTVVDADNIHRADATSVKN